MSKLDIIISLGTKDCFIVKKTIRYININITDVDNIYIITDMRNKIFFSHAFLKNNKVTIIDENELINNVNFSYIKKLVDNHFCQLKVNMSGWYFQQILKMGFALTGYAKDNYLIWDADTIPLRKLNFVVENNKKFYITPKTEYHKPYFSSMKALIQIGKTFDYSFISEHMVIKTSIMKELIKRVESSPVTGDHWVEKIINSTDPSEPNGFSEFETYGTYCGVQHPDLYQLRELRTFRNAGKLYGRGVKDKQLAVLAQKYDMASFEKRHIPPFPMNISSFCSKFIFKIILYARH